MLRELEGERGMRGREEGGRLTDCLGRGDTRRAYMGQVSPH